MRITETALARQHMTPQSAALLRDSTLDMRLGRGTLAGSLNDQLRFRFDKGDGAPSTWGLIPDNQLSAQLLASPAGTKLESKLRDVLATVDRGHARGALELQGIMLSDDAESWAAGLALMQRDAARTSSAPMARPYSLPKLLEAAKASMGIVGAQSIWGWVHLSPDHARNVLTSIGAYSPARGEAFARSGRVAEALGPLLGHELEHRVSEAPLRTNKQFLDYTPYAWLEEGTATLLEMRLAAPSTANVAAWGVSARQHAGHVTAPDSFHTGWKPWLPKAPTTSPELDEMMDANYVDSVETISGLLWLAGVNPTTRAGLERTEQLLQDVEVTQVPKRIATTLLDAWNITASPARVRELTELVLGANGPDGISRVQHALQRLVR